MKKILFAILFSPLVAYGQSIEEIQRGTEYLYGIGKSSTLKQADNEALEDLISQISVSVSSKFEQLQAGESSGGKEVIKETFQSVINTYSKATLNNTKRIIIEDEPRASVLRFIKKSEIQQIFEGRKNKLIDFATEAIKAEKKAQIADALRYYYWALTLLKSYPDGSFLKMADDAGKEQLLYTWIPQQMNEIFSHIAVSASDATTEGGLKTVNLQILYKGQPARNYDYTYFDGRDWSNIYSAKDGIGIIEFPAIADIKGIQIKTEYVFEGEATIDSELANVMESVPAVSMRNSILKIGSDKTTPQKRQIYPSSVSQGEKAIRYLSDTECSSYQDIMQKVETAIRSKNYSIAQTLCTPDGYDMFTRLIKYGRATIIRPPSYQYLECNGEITCRSIPMSFSFEGNQRTFVEDVVFTFNGNKQISGLSFGLNKAAVGDILNQTSWNNNVRTVLINFLESYKTAYALKRYQYIESIFSDDALIITGSVLKHRASTENQPMNKEVVKYSRQTKSEYMKKLKHIFAGNEYINLRFTDNQIRKAGVGGEVYGIQIQQDYFSSNYGDSGYLFLLVDLNNPQEPVIHVRTWQPEKDPDFGLIDLSYF